MTGLSGILCPGRSRIVHAAAAPSYMDDLVVFFPCTDGAPNYPILTNTKGDDATIYSAGSGVTYPGGQQYPYFDGINDYASAGNLVEANIADNLAFCIWFDDWNAVGNTNAIIGKYESAGDKRQWRLYRTYSNMVFWITKDGTYGSGAYIAGTGPSSGAEWFYCGVYQYVTNGTSKMYLFSNRGTPDTLYQENYSLMAPGPLHTDDGYFALAAVNAQSTPIQFAEMSVKRAEVFHVSSQYIAGWLDGTYPELRRQAGSGQQ